MKLFIVIPKLARFLFFSNLVILSLFSQTSMATLLSPVFINEIHYDNIGGDINEFIEIAAPAGTSLKDWSLAFYNGSNGLTYKNEILSDSIMIDDEINGFGFYSVFISGIQNGSNDGIALINASNELIQFISYEGTITALDGFAYGETSEDINVFEPSDTPEGFSLQLAGRGQFYQDFSWQTAALSSVNKVNNEQQFMQSAANPATPIDTPSILPLFFIALYFLRQVGLLKQN